MSGPARIEDYAMIGDCLTAALVSRDGSIDWLCWPRFDSDACFAALVGNDEHGQWLIGPARKGYKTTRSYRDDSIVLETVFTTDEGEIALIDFMPVGHSDPAVIRIVEGRRGRVDVAMVLSLRFGYGADIPWVTRLPDDTGIQAIVGPDMVVLRTAVELHGVDMKTTAGFTVAEGERVTFTLSHVRSHLGVPSPIDAEACLTQTERYWAEWSGRCTYQGRYGKQVRRSLMTLKALTYAPTGGIVAAPTTSLPEEIGGSRNWDYRFCWLRDATITLLAFMKCGYFEEAKAWRDWLHRSIAGNPAQIQIMYGVAGERRLSEWEVDWLPGYEGSRPVRIGNAAHQQVQLDVYGEVMDALYQGRVGGLDTNETGWALQCNVLEHLITIWEKPDEGIWEVRGGARQFTFSKVMAWVAVDRTIRSAEEANLPGPIDEWRALRQAMHDKICHEGFNTQRGIFTQSFGSEALDADLLLLSQVGFLPSDDPRIQATVAAVESELMRDGLVLRYQTTGDDGLAGSEGAFLACSFWLVMSMAQDGRKTEARALFERLLALCNDVGLLSEEFDSVKGRLVGNFPQAFSHVALVGAALALVDEPMREATATD